MAFVAARGPDRAAARSSSSRTPSRRRASALEVDRIVHRQGPRRPARRTRPSWWPSRCSRSTRCPTSASCASPSTPARCRPRRSTSLRQLVRDFPGDTPVVVELATSRGARRLRLGSELPRARRAAVLRRGARAYRRRDARLTPRVEPGAAPGGGITPSSTPAGSSRLVSACATAPVGVSVTPEATGRCRARRRRAHVVAHRRQQVGKGLDVVARKRLEQQVIDDLDVTGEHLAEPRASGVGDRDRDAALVVRRGGARDQTRLLEQAGLVGQAAAAVDDAVGQVGHAVAARRRAAETGQELELHVAEAAGLAQLLLDRVPQQADHLDQGEVGAELNGVEGRRGIGHAPILLASNSKRCYRDCRCFEFEAHPQTK